MVTTVIVVSEVARKQIDQTIAVKVAPGGADGMAAAPAGVRVTCVGMGLINGHVHEVARTVVAVQKIGLQAVVRDVNIQVAVLIEIGGRDTSPRNNIRLHPGHGEGVILVVGENKVALGPRILVARDVHVEVTVVVEVAQGGTTTYAVGGGWQGDFNKRGAVDVAKESVFIVTVNI